jgi:adenylate kinase family enzyme
MSRFLIIGAGGSGKSTLSKLISSKLNLPYYDTDSMYWKPGWVLSSDEDVVSQLPLSELNWVIDGNFVQHRDIVWKNADHIVWLKRPAILVLVRVIRRNLSWWWTGDPSWSQNIMPFKIAFTGILHTISQVWRHPKEFAEYLVDVPNDKLTIIRSNAEYQLFIESLVPTGQQKDRKDLRP